ncbi:hypothetical protein LINPERHAP1_LOCUS3452, partial [Linum perenne]
GSPFGHPHPRLNSGPASETGPRAGRLLTVFIDSRLLLALPALAESPQTKKWPKPTHLD